jgi:hypothetical protein
MAVGPTERRHDRRERAVAAFDETDAKVTADAIRYR